MQLDGLEVFALHAALGSTLLLSTLLLCSYVLAEDWMAFALARVRDTPGALLAGLTAIAILSGLLLDNIADFVDDEEALPWLLESEKKLRADVLFEQEPSSDQCTPQPLAVQLAEKGVFLSHAPGFTADLQNSILSNRAFTMNPKRLRDATSALYYRARSRVLRESVYAEELHRIHRDISVLRSMSMLGLLLGILAPIAGCLRAWKQALPANAWLLLRLSLLLGLPLLFALLCGRITSEEEKSYNKRTFAFFESISNVENQD